MKKTLYCALAVLMACTASVFTACDDDDADPLVISTELPETKLVGEYEGTWTLTSNETGEVTGTGEGSITVELLNSEEGGLQDYAAVVTLHCATQDAIDGKSGICNVTVANGVITCSNSTSKEIGTSGHFGQYDQQADVMTFNFANSVKVGRKYVATLITFEGKKK